MSVMRNFSLGEKFALLGFVASFDPTRYGVDVHETVVTFDPFVRAGQAKLVTAPPAKADRPADEQGESRQLESEGKRLVLRGTRSARSSPVRRSRNLSSKTSSPAVSTL